MSRRVSSTYRMRSSGFRVLRLADGSPPSGTDGKSLATRCSAGPTWRHGRPTKRTRTLGGMSGSEPRRATFGGRCSAEDQYRTGPDRWWSHDHTRMLDRRYRQSWTPPVCRSGEVGAGAPSDVGRWVHAVSYTRRAAQPGDGGLRVRAYQRGSAHSDGQDSLDRQRRAFVASKSADVAGPAARAGTSRYVTDRERGVLRTAYNPRRLTPPTHRLYPGLYPGLYVAGSALVNIPPHTPDS